MLTTGLLFRTTSKNVFQNHVSMCSNTEMSRRDAAPSGKLSVPKIRKTRKIVQGRMPRQELPREENECKACSGNKPRSIPDTSQENKNRQGDLRRLECFSLRPRTLACGTGEWPKTPISPTISGKCDQRNVSIRSLWEKFGTWALPACLVQEVHVHELLQFTPRREATRYLISPTSDWSDGNPRLEASWKGIWVCTVGKVLQELHLDCKKLQRSRLLQRELVLHGPGGQNHQQTLNGSCPSPRRRPYMEFLASDLVFILFFRVRGDTWWIKRIKNAYITNMKGQTLNE